MDFKKLLLPLALVSTGAVADEYQSFTSAGVEAIDVGDSSEAFVIGSQYYFAPQQALGPRDEFGYFDDTSNVFGAYANGEFVDLLNVGGEAYLDNFVVGAAYSYVDTDFGSSYLLEMRLGYFVTDDVLLKAYAYKPEDGDTNYELTAGYNHQINDTDYLGVTLLTNEELDYVSVESKYFADLGGETYLSTEFALADMFDSNIWEFAVRYYFSKDTAIGATVADEEAYGVEFTHFFNENYAIEASASLQDNDGFEDTKTYFLGLTAQF